MPTGTSPTHVHVKYMFGDSKVDASIYNDWGGSQYNFFVNYDTSLLNLKSHELQITGDLFEKKVSYVLGGYKWKQNFRNRGVEWSMMDWLGAGGAVNNSGTIQTLNYQTVLNSAACQRTPAQVGRSFIGQPNWLGQTITTNTTVAGWPFPCNWAGGEGWIGVFKGVGNTSDRLNGATQDGTAFFGEGTWNVTDAWSVTAGYRHHKQDNVSLGIQRASIPPGDRGAPGGAEYAVQEPLRRSGRHLQPCAIRPASARTRSVSRPASTSTIR